MSEEVELGEGGAGDDYEVVPVGPLRKLERRVDELQEQNQGSGSDDKLVEDVIDIMKSNQKIVNDMTESTHQLRNSVQDLTHKMDEVVDNMNNFMDVMTQASEMDMKGEVVGDIESRITGDIADKMDEVVQEMNESNQEVVNHLKDVNKSLRRSYAAENKEALLSNDQRHQEQQETQAPAEGREPNQNQEIQQQETQPTSQQQGQRNNTNNESRSRSPNSGRRRNPQQQQDNAEMDLGGQNNDRLDKLKEKFNKQGSEE